MRVTSLFREAFSMSSSIMVTIRNGRSSGVVGSSGTILYMYSSSTVPSTEKGYVPGSNASARQISLFMPVILYCFYTSSFSIQLLVFRPSRQCNLLRPSVRSGTFECCMVVHAVKLLYFLTENDGRSEMMARYK